MIVFTRLLLENVGPFARLELRLDGRGLVLIIGENNDTTSANSNGTGKSHIFIGLSWCLWGEGCVVGGTDRLIRNGEKEAIAAISWYDDTEEDPAVYMLARSKARGKSMQLRLECDNQDISMPTIAATQAEVGRLLGMDQQTWFNTVMYAQGDLVRFADPGTTDAERKSILKRILRLEVMDKAAKVAKDKLDKINTRLIAIDRENAALEASLAASADLNAVKEQLELLEDETNKLEKKSRTLERLRSISNDIQEQIDEIGERGKEADKLGTEATKQTAEAARARAEAQAYARDVSRINAAIDEISGEKCPTCGSSTEEMSVVSKRLALNAEAAAAAKAAIDAGSRATKADKLAGEAKAASEAIRAEIRAEVRDWAMKQNEVKREITLAEAAEGAAIMNRRKVDAARRQLEQLTEQRSNLEQRWQELAEELGELNENKLELEFWVKGFGNQGVPSYLMDSVVPDLAERANHYLDVLSDGDIRVRFDTQSKLKSGETREKLAMLWNIEGVDDVNPSGGQRKKISIAVDLALMDLVANRERASIDLLMMDEVLDGLDATGKARIMDLLSELRARRSSIFVISHDSGITELFETTVTVRKEGRVARLEA